MTDPVLETMRRHRSVRAFLPEPLPDGAIREAVGAAQQAATSSWIQGYALLQVEDAAERATLAELCGGQRQVAEAGAFFVVCGDVRRHRLVAQDAGAERVDNLETFLLAVVDATLFAQNLILAFESQGYGTCCIGGLRNRLPEVDALLELPEGVWPLFGLCVGAPDPSVATEVRPRLPVDGVWMKGRYADDDVLRAAIATHDVDAAAHYAARGLDGRNWSGGVWRRFAKSARDDLAAYYASKGARLT